jgi:hypothetical protein
MSQHHCEQCRTPYGDLQRAGQDQLFVCNECGRESCDRCVQRELEGPQVWSLRCPNCSAFALEQVALTARFSIYSSLAQLTTPRRSIALLFVPWSVYPKRNETLIKEALSRLEEFHPSFFLLNEDDRSIREAISEWFPAVCNPETATGNGAVIWLRDGQPADSLPGGPFTAKLEILDHSRKAWPLG